MLKLIEITKLKAPLGGLGVYYRDVIILVIVLHKLTVPLPRSSTGWIYSAHYGA
jgi:hypothetical protein